MSSLAKNTICFQFCGVSSLLVRTRLLALVASTEVLLDYCMRQLYNTFIVISSERYDVYTLKQELATLLAQLLANREIYATKLLKNLSVNSREM